MANETSRNIYYLQKNYINVYDNANRPTDITTNVENEYSTIQKGEFGFTWALTLTGNIKIETSVNLLLSGRLLDDNS